MELIVIAAAKRNARVDAETVLVQQVLCHREKSTQVCLHIK